MRRKARNPNNKKNISMGDKVIKYSSIGVTILTIVVIAMLIYSKNLSDKVKKESLSSKEIENLINDTQIESANSKIGKTVNEVLTEHKEEMKPQNVIKKEEKVQKVEEHKIEQNKVKENKVKENKVNNDAKTSKKENEIKQNGNEKINKNKEEKQEEKKHEEKIIKEVKKLEFIKPVDGEIVKDFSKENLIYSETLQEWTTHTGIDIKAEKTTVVKSAEEGKVKSIKNDPRFGLTIVVEHENGFQTVYANLLTSEFVVENEKVKKGQSLGTVGNTASFEIAEEPHLHFEIIKDQIKVDPKLYLK